MLIEETKSQPVYTSKLLPGKTFTDLQDINYEVQRELVIRAIMVHKSRKRSYTSLSTLRSSATRDEPWVLMMIANLDAKLTDYVDKILSEYEIVLEEYAQATEPEPVPE